MYRKREKQDWKQITTQISKIAPKVILLGVQINQKGVSHDKSKKHIHK